MSNEKSFTDENLQTETTYTYQVSALDTAGNEGERSDTVIIVTPDVTPPAKIEGLTVKPETSTRVILAWNASSASDFHHYNIYRNDNLITLKISNSHVDVNLQEKTEYGYSVSAVDNAGNEGEKSDIIKVVTLDITPPEKVVIKDVALKSFTEIELKWTKNIEIDLKHYSIYRNNSKIAETTDPIYIDTELQPMMEYVYHVSAVDKVGNEGEKSEPADIKTSLRVLGINVQGIFPVKFSWLHISDIEVSHYNIYKDDIRIAEEKGNEYIDYDVYSNTTYVYEISAVDKLGNEGEKRSFSHTIPDIHALDKVEDIDVIIVAPTEILIEWKSSLRVGVKHYNIYRNDEKIAETTELTYLDTELQTEKEYSYQISETYISGEEGEKSEQVSATTPDITPPAKIEGLTAQALSSSEIKLEWKASEEPELEFYSVYRSRIGERPYEFRTTENSYIDSRLEANTEYVYEVSAMDTASNIGEKSDSVTLTTPKAEEPPEEKEPPKKKPLKKKPPKKKPPKKKIPKKKPPKKKPVKKKPKPSRGCLSGMQNLITLKEEAVRNLNRTN